MFFSRKPLAKFSEIKLLVLDIDGTLTNGTTRFEKIDGKFEPVMDFCEKDLKAIRQLMDKGIQVAIMTGRTSSCVANLAKDLGIPENLVYQGIKDKTEASRELREKLELAPENTAYVGDDIQDLKAICDDACGYFFAVANARPFVKHHADYITKRSGGKGAVADVCTSILESAFYCHSDLDAGIQMTETLSNWIDIQKVIIHIDTLMGEDGSFNIQDGKGLKMLSEALGDENLVIITDSEPSELIAFRIKENLKLPLANLETFNINEFSGSSEVLYVGANRDSISDTLPFYETSFGNIGGNIRNFVEIFLTSKGLLEAMENQYFPLKRTLGLKR